MAFHSKYFSLYSALKLITNSKKCYYITLVPGQDLDIFVRNKFPTTITNFGFGALVTEY